MKPKYSANDYVVKFLAIRDYSEWELIKKLREKGFAEGEIQPAIQEAWDRNWLLPPEELSQKVLRMLNRKNKSSRYIQSYLAQRKLPAVTIDDDIEFSKAYQLAEKKFQNNEAFTFEDKKKVLQYLRNRAFQESVIRMVIDELERN